MAVRGEEILRIDLAEQLPSYPEEGGRHELRPIFPSRFCWTTPTPPSGRDGVMD
jgi:hypothetical protein